jgi:hypothetical protein
LFSSDAVPILLDRLLRLNGSLKGEPEIGREAGAAGRRKRMAYGKIFDISNLDESGCIRAEQDAAPHVPADWLWREEARQFRIEFDPRHDRGYHQYDQNDRSPQYKREVGLIQVALRTVSGPVILLMSDPAHL